MRTRSVRLGRPGARDWAVAALFVVLHALSPRTGPPAAEATWVGSLALVLAVGQGVPLAWRRQRPVGVAVVVLACYAAYVVTVGLVPPFAAWMAIWSIGTARTDRWRSTRAALLAASATAVLVIFGELATVGSGAFVLYLSATAVVTLAAVLVRTEQARLDAVRQRASSEERLRIARDLHDLVGHGLGIVAVQSSTARMALDSGDTETARRALGAVETTSRTALREMRQLLGVLRDLGGEPLESSGRDGPSAPGVADIASLVDNVRLGGVAISAEIAADVEDVPQAIQLCAYRVVQEALTNTVKHAPGAIVAVQTSRSEQTLNVAVESSGGSTAEPRTESGGLGLEGIRTRVAAVGGQTRIGRTATGWRVEAELPVRLEE